MSTPNIIWAGWSGDPTWDALPYWDDEFDKDSPWPAYLNRDTALALCEAELLSRDGTDTTDARNSGVQACMEALRGME